MRSETIIGYHDLPTKTITVNTAAQVLQVPSTNGLYPGLPSPALPASSALSIGLSDISGSQAFDAHFFKICVAGTVLEAAGGVFTMTLYQLAASQIGQIGAAAPVTAAGAAGTGATTMGAVFSGVALTSATGRFRSETVCVWDSTSLQLSSIHTYRSWVITGSNSNFVAVAAGTSIASVAAVTDLNFMLSFQFGTAAATNAVTVKEFTIERV